MALGTLMTMHVLFVHYIANLFTKPLPRNAFENSSCKLRIWDSPFPNLRRSEGIDLSIKGEKFGDINQNYKLIFGYARIKGLTTLVI